MVSNVNVPVTDFGLGLFANVTRHGRNSVQKIIKALNKNAVGSCNVKLDITHKATIIDDYRYDSAIQPNNNSVLLLSGVLALLNHDDDSALHFTSTGRIKQVDGGAVFKRNGGGEQWQQIFVNYGRNTGFSFTK